jgi:glycosyltransferase involved in cell wall biosynthesis
MRILYHHRTLADGAEGVHIDEMVAAFRDLGHEVRVSGVTSASGWPRRPGLIGAVKRSLPRAAFEMASLALNAIEYAKVGAELRQHRPTFLYARHARYSVGALAAARAAGVDSVLEVNCLFSHQRYRRFEPVAFRSLARRLEAQAIESATVVLAVSTPLARQVDELVPGKAHVIPNGVDPARFDRRRASTGRVRRQHGLEGRTVVGWVGVLREWHGLDILLDAIAAGRSAPAVAASRG